MIVWFNGNKNETAARNKRDTNDETMICKINTKSLQLTKNENTTKFDMNFFSSKWRRQENDLNSLSSFKWRFFSWYPHSLLCFLFKIYFDLLPFVLSDTNNFQNSNFKRYHPLVSKPAMVVYSLHEISIFIVVLEME